MKRQYTHLPTEPELTLAWLIFGAGRVYNGYPTVAVYVHPSRLARTIELVQKISTTLPVTYFNVLGDSEFALDEWCVQEMPGTDSVGADPP